MKQSIFAVCLLASPLAFSASMVASAHYWECITTDRSGHEWIAQDVYERVAANHAYDACKKQSDMPKTCKASKEACEHFINGKSTKPIWQCTALDQRAKAWKSNGYANRDDAALAAKAYCQENSAVPGSCYVNLITCVNLNKG